MILSEANHLVSVRGATCVDGRSKHTPERSQQLHFLFGFPPTMTSVREIVLLVSATTSASCLNPTFSIAIHYCSNIWGQLDFFRNTFVQQGQIKCDRKDISNGTKDFCFFNKCWLIEKKKNVWRKTVWNNQDILMLKKKVSSSYRSCIYILVRHTVKTAILWDILT